MEFLVLLFSKVVMVIMATLSEANLLLFLQKLGGLSGIQSMKIEVFMSSVSIIIFCTAFQSSMFGVASV